MLSHRAVLTLQSKEVFSPEMDLSAQRMSSQWNCYRVSRALGRTHRLILLQGFVMSPPQLRPFRKFVLRAGVVHLAFELEDLTLLALLFACIP